ncbi:MAG TPA: EamA family transporter [Nitrospirota bacterium]|nr:EamA family transporter [Nitrospirota bacterium]
MKTYIVVLIAAFSAAVGESLLSFGMRRYGSLNLAEPSQWLVLVSSVILNRYVFLGVVFLGIFFFLYLAALSWADLSFILPLTAVSYLFAALLAKFFLKEEVSWYRWIGTIVIVIGIAMVAFGGKSRSVVPLPDLLPADPQGITAGLTEADRHSCDFFAQRTPSLDKTAIREEGKQ